MLRAIKQRHVRPRMMGFRVNSTSTSPVAEVNSDNILSLTDHGAGDTTITFKNPYQRDSLVFATCDTDVGNGAIGNLSATSLTSCRVVANNSAGSGADGTIDVLSFGFDSIESYPAAPLYHHIYTPVYSPRIIGFHVDGTGTASLVSGKFQGTLTDNGTGDYTITFNRQFAEAPLIFGTVIGSTAGVVNKVTSSVSNVNVKTFDAAGNATDLDFYLFVVGKDTPGQAAGIKRAVQTPQRLARAEVFELTVTTGTPSLTTGLGSHAGSIADTGTGIFTLTFSEKFKRVPQVLLTAGGSNIANIDSVAVDSCVIRTFTNAGVAADPTVVHGLVLGYDDVTEY